MKTIEERVSLLEKIIKKLVVILFVFLLVLVSMIFSSCSPYKKMSHYPDGCRPEKHTYEMVQPTYDKTVKK